MRIQKITIELVPNESEKKMTPPPSNKILIWQDSHWFVENEKGLRGGEIRLADAINKIRDTVGSI